MRGISEARLREIVEDYPKDHRTHRMAKYLIATECQELQEPWMPIDEFLKSEFIGACWVYTDTEFVYTAYYAKDGQFYESDLTECRLDRNTIVRVMPLHKPEPPR